MPETPMPAVNGHVTSDRLLQASRSSSSFAPAAAMVGTYGFTATAGSFCLFCGNGAGWLPMVTSVSPAFGVAAATPSRTANAASVANDPARIFFINSPPLDASEATGISNPQSPLTSLARRRSQPGRGAVEASCSVDVERDAKGLAQAV